MGMVKIVSPSGWDFDGPAVRLVKVGQYGLRGNDRKEFLKFASHAFLPFVDQIKMADGEVPIHVISHGATEAYGPNRNGDGFKEATCLSCHPTFEKYAQHYRNHQNRPHEGHPHYGVVKKAVYNDVMRRVELLTGLFSTKAAAERRDNGKVADRELEKLASGENLATSMACRVPKDRCSWCGNEARTRDDYCTAAMCKAGGCKSNLTKLIKVGNDLHHLHVDNPAPLVWFDSSTVWRPADRTAYGNKADWLVKAAADADGFFGIGGARTAEELGVVAPAALLFEPALCGHAVTDEQVKLAHALDLLDRQPELWLNRQFLRAFDERLQGRLDVSQLGEPGTPKCAEALGALADQKIIVPLRDFAVLVKQADLVAAARPLLRGVYGRMSADGSLERRLEKNAFALSTQLAAWRTRQWANRLAAAFSLEKSAVDRRARLSTVRDYVVPDESAFVGVKTAGDAAAAEELARSYACYRVAALQRIAGFDDDFPLTARLVLVQNQGL